MASDKDNNVEKSPLHNLVQGCSVEHLLELAHSPSSNFYKALEYRIQHDTLGDLLHDGYSGGGGGGGILGALLDTLVGLSSSSLSPVLVGSQISDAVLQLDCLGCLHAIVDTRVGIGALMYQAEAGVDKLVLALDTPNVHPKKVLVELLTVLCLYSKRGQTLVVQAFENFKLSKHHNHQYSILCAELKQACTPSYRKSLLGLINALINSHAELMARCRTRMQFVGLGLLDTINKLRVEEREAEVAVQLETFDVQKHKDDAEMARVHPKIDLHSHTEICAAVTDRVFGSPSSTYFLHVLQDLYALDLRGGSDRSMLWPTIAMTTQHIANLKGTSEVESFLSKLREFLEPPKTSSKAVLENSVHQVEKNIEVENSIQPVESSVQKDYADIPDIDSEVFVNNDAILTCSPDMKSGKNDRRDSGISMGSRRDSDFGTSVSSPQSPYDNVNSVGGVVHRQRSSKRDSTRSQKRLTLEPVPEDGIGVIKTENLKRDEKKNTRPDTPTIENSLAKPAFKTGVAKRPQSLTLLQETGVEDENDDDKKGSTEKTKLVKWVKLPENIAKGEMCIWKQMHESGSVTLPLNAGMLHKEFTDPHPGRINADDEICLLDSKTSLALNLWIARMEGNPEDLVEPLAEGDTADFGIGALRQLIQILPSEREVQQLSSYSGSIYELGQAEQFLIHLAARIPHYPALLDGLLFKAEFGAEFTRMKTGVSAMVRSARDVLHHHGFRDFLKMLLNSGNSLNQCQYNKSAPGITLPSLIRCTEVKGRHHHSNLLSWVTTEVEQQEEGMLSFVNDFVSLELAASHNIEATVASMTELNTRLKKLITNLKVADDQVKDIFGDFIEDVKQDLEELRDLLTCLRSLTNQLAAYFGESTADFSIQACFKHLHDFVTQVRRCQNGGHFLRSQKTLAAEKIAALQSKDQTRQEIKRFGKKADLCSSMLLPHMDQVVQTILDQVSLGKTHGFHSNDLLMTPGSETIGDPDPFLVSRISPGAVITAPQTPDGDLELSLDVDGLMLQPSVSEELLLDPDNDEQSIGTVDPKLLRDFKAAMSKNRIDALKTPDHLQSTPIAGNLKGLSEFSGKNVTAKKCLMPAVSPVCSPAKFVKVEEENCQKKATVLTLITPSTQDKDRDALVGKKPEGEIKLTQGLKCDEKLSSQSPVESEIKDEKKDADGYVMDQVDGNIMNSGKTKATDDEDLKPLKVKIPLERVPSKAEPEDLSPMSEACFNLLEDQGSLSVHSPTEIATEVTNGKAPSPEMLKIRVYPKYKYDQPLPHKPNVMEIKREKRESLNKDVSDPIYKSRENDLDAIGVDMGPRIPRLERGRDPKCMTPRKGDTTPKDKRTDVFVFGSGKTRNEFVSPDVPKYSFTVQRPVSSPAAPSSHPVQTSSKPVRTSSLAIPKSRTSPAVSDGSSSSTKSNITPPGGLTTGMPRTNSSTKLGLQRTSNLKPLSVKTGTTKISQPQMGKLALKCGSDGNVNRGGSAERRSNVPGGEAVPGGGRTPPIALMDTMDALDLSSSVIPRSPDLQTKVFSAVRQKEQEAEAQKKLKQDQMSLKKKSNFGIFRRFQKAFKSTREDSRQPRVIENPAVQPSNEEMFDETDTSLVSPATPCNPNNMQSEGTELSESFVMVKPGKDREKGIRKLKPVKKKQPVEAESQGYAGSPMVYAKTEQPQFPKKKSPLKSSISDPGNKSEQRRGLQEPKKVLYPMVPRSSRSLPSSNQAELSTPPSGMIPPRSSSLPTKPVGQLDPWKRRSGVQAQQQQDSSQKSDSVSSLSSEQGSVRSRTYSNASRSSGIQHNSGGVKLSESQTSITSKSSTCSAEGGGRFRRPSAEGKRPRISSTRSILTPEPAEKPVSQANPTTKSVKSRLQAPKTTSPNSNPAPGIVYKPNPMKPLAFRDHNRTEGGQAGKKDTRVAQQKPAETSKISRLPTMGKENSVKSGEAGSFKLQHYRQGSSVA